MSLTTRGSISELEKVAPAQAAPVTPPPQASVSLPDKPMVTIEPRGSWTALNLREIWAHRELLYFLTWRDVKVATAAVSATGAVLHPLSEWSSSRSSTGAGRQ